MDRFIGNFEPQLTDGALHYCPEHGVAYQADMQAGRIPYNGAYFDHYVKLEGQPIALMLNAGRVQLVNKHVGPETGVLDVGIGSGEFLMSRPNTFGYDVNKRAEAWLKAANRWSDKFSVFEAFTFWDVLEHVETPEQDYFRHMRPGTHLFTSLPIFNSLWDIRNSKHYKPGEHLYYFTEPGFLNWMKRHGWQHLDTQDYETRAGREGILSFAFRRA